MNFFWELYTEEIPAGYQPNVKNHWQKKIAELLQQHSIVYENFSVQATARRVVCSAQVALQQANSEEELKGPPKNICFDKQGKPTKALIGFAAKVSLSTEDVTFKLLGNTEYAFAVKKSGGKTTEQILPEIFEQVITSTHFPRQMRWANHTLSYARPIIGYYGWLDNSQLQFHSGIWETIKPLEGVQGHQILQRDFKEVKSFSEYQELLKSYDIVLNDAERKTVIKKLLQETAASLDLEAVISPQLLDEVNFLSERPTVVWGEFPSSFLQLPEKVILSEMENHQRYFALKQKDKKLSEKFLIVANANTNDEQTRKNVKEGNERVLKARLSDGQFFFDEDRKQPLSASVEKLKTIVFQEGMGNMFEKKERLKQIALSLAKFLPASHTFKEELLLRAADLCKSDLTTQLVYEFDSLQGEIGSVYASLDGEHPAVALAIKEHYLPKFQGDDFPSDTIGILLSLADKLDNIVAGFLLDKAPTSSQDPLALRRQCLYVIEILIEQKISFGFENFLPNLEELYPQKFAQKFSQIVPDILEFIKGRLVTIFNKGGFDITMIRAALFHGETNILQLYYRLTALDKTRKHENFEAMMQAFKRMNNIIAKADTQKVSAATVQLMELDEEKKLLEFAQTLQQKSEALQNAESTSQGYEDFFETIAHAKILVDNFFDNVMVNHEDEKIKNNRIALLQNIVSAVEQVLALSQLQS